MIPASKAKQLSDLNNITPEQIRVVDMLTTIDNAIQQAAGNGKYETTVYFEDEPHEIIFNYLDEAGYQYIYHSHTYKYTIIIYWKGDSK